MNVYSDGRRRPGLRSQRGCDPTAEHASRTWWRLLPRGSALGWRWTWPLGTVLSVIIVALWALGRSGPTGSHLIDTAFTYRAGLPTVRAALTLLPSMLSPALNLPVWGAAAQVAVVFGIGQAMLGWRQAMTVALAGHVAATLTARILILDVSPDTLSHYLWVRDTGPSAATVALAVYLALRLRKAAIAAMLVAAMIAEFLVQPNLAASEHLVAAAVALVAACASQWSFDDIATRARSRRRELAAELALTPLAALGWRSASWQGSPRRSPPERRSTNRDVVGLPGPAHQPRDGNTISTTHNQADV